MKIAILLNIKKYQGGAERRIARYSNYIMSKGLAEVYLIVEGDKKNIDPFVEKYIFAENIGSIRKIRSFTEFFKVLKEVQPDIFQFFDCSGSLVFYYLIGKMLSKKVVCDMASIYIPSGYFYSLLGKFVCLPFLSTIDGIFCLYPSKVTTLKRLLSNFPINLFSRNLTIVSSPCSFTDLDLFQPKPKKKNHVVFSGRLVSFKNPLLYLKAVSKCQSLFRQLGYKSFILGMGPLKEEVQKQIIEYSIEDIVDFREDVDTSKFLSESKVFLSIQEDENYPSQSLLEAIACGNFIIATNVGDSHLIVKKPFGVLVNKDLEDITIELEKAMRDLIDDDYEKSIIKNARNFAEEHFSIKEYSEFVICFWKDLLGVGETLR